ncbi:HxlR family transcriptional regulator [Flavobacteriaceae bacterium CRH]|nr:HxlR family transcriptional regulator [Flavobacteriaceae bacterium CRH]
MKTKEEKVVKNQAECAQSIRNVIDAMFVLNGKWKLPLIQCISQSAKRFSEIQNEVPISPKVLANELKHLELNNFIKRQVFPTTPVTIIYEATEYCMTLKNVICELDQWGEKHRKVITGK